MTTSTPIRKTPEEWAFEFFPDDTTKIRGETYACASPSTKLALYKASNAAKNLDPVIILGATGTGKENIAQFIHTESGRTGRFLAVNCKTIPENVAESLLFGHKSGAFTGAIQKHAGFFEQANRGTIFLDEIHTLSKDNQDRLLRLLDKPIIQRLGGEEHINLDVKIICATSANISQAHLQEEFFQRINGSQILLPPLKDRTEDLSVLIDLFIKNGSPSMTISPEARNKLLNSGYSWPGNIRELKNCINSAKEHANLCYGGTLPGTTEITVEDIGGLNSSSLTTPGALISNATMALLGKKLASLQELVGQQGQQIKILQQQGTQTQPPTLTDLQNLTPRQKSTAIEALVSLVKIGQITDAIFDDLKRSNLPNTSRNYKTLEALHNFCSNCNQLIQDIVTSSRDSENRTNRTSCASRTNVVNNSIRKMLSTHPSEITLLNKLDKSLFDRCCALHDLRTKILSEIIPSDRSALTAHSLNNLVNQIKLAVSGNSTECRAAGQ